MSHLRTTLSTHVKFSDAEWSDFESRLLEKSLKKDELYLSEGQVSKKVGLVTSGGVRMFYRIRGEEYCKDFQFEGQFTGSIESLFSQRPARFSIAALEDTTLLELSKPDLDYLFDTYKNWERFGRLYAEGLFVYKEKREASLLFDSSTTRYENMLRDQPQHMHRIPLKYLASYLGIKPESLSRIRKKISKAGIRT